MGYKIPRELCEHPADRIVAFATPGGFYKCKDCGELFYEKPGGKRGSA